MKFFVRPFILFTFAFMLCTIIGTVSHEYGHMVVARMLGYQPELHYAYMDYHSPFKNEVMQKGAELYEGLDSDLEIYERNTSLDPEILATYRANMKKLVHDARLITVGGPLQTILTGTVGLLILLFSLKRIRNEGFRFLDWVWVFMALFWLREIFNLLAPTRALWFNRDIESRGDERVISIGLGWHEYTLPLIMGILGLIICAYVVLRIVPRQLRLTFILSGFIGGISGFILWMNYLGPALLP